MIADERPAAQDLNDEARILRCIEEHDEEGISTFALTSELHLKSALIAPIVDRMKNDDKIHGEKRGFIYYWKPGPAPKDEGEEAAWGRITDDKYKEAPKEGIKAEAGPTRVPCPVAGCPTMILAGRDHVATHLREQHPALSPRERTELADHASDGARLEPPKAPDRRIGRETKSKAKKGTKPEEPKPKRTGGRPPKDPNVPRAPCPIDGCDVILAMTRDNVNHHLTGKHKLAKVEVRAYLEKLFPKPADEPLSPTSAPLSSPDKGTSSEACSIKKEEVDELAEAPDPSPNGPFDELRCDNCGKVLGEICCTDHKGEGHFCSVLCADISEDKLPDSQPGTGELAEASKKELACTVVGEDCRKCQAGELTVKDPCPLKEEAKAKGWGILNDGKMVRMVDIPSPAVPVAHVVESSPSIVHRDAGNAPIGKDLGKMFRPESEKASNPIQEVSKGREEPASQASNDVQPRDPLEQLVELHSRRLRKDIRAMKRTENRMVRRAIASVKTKTRIEAARRIKERELRRFEEDLAKVKGARD